MECKKRLLDDKFIIILEGKFCFEDHTNFKKMCLDFYDSGHDSVTVDLTKVTFMDTAALALLMLLQDKISESEKSLSFEVVNGSVQKMLQLSKIC